uniref:Uncharacterized protein n=1 Tax=Rhizochromulina marina TaxID=1034831 RepID=A0A7S2WW92_9STRA
MHLGGRHRSRASSVPGLHSVVLVLGVLGVSSQPLRGPGFTNQEAMAHVKEMHEWWCKGQHEESALCHALRLRDSALDRPVTPRERPSHEEIHAMHSQFCNNPRNHGKAPCVWRRVGRKHNNPSYSLFRTS